MKLFQNSIGLAITAAAALAIASPALAGGPNVISGNVIATSGGKGVAPWGGVISTSYTDAFIQLKTGKKGKKGCGCLDGKVVGAAGNTTVAKGPGRARSRSTTRLNASLISGGKPKGRGGKKRR